MQALVLVIVVLAVIALVGAAASLFGADSRELESRETGWWPADSSEAASR